MEKTVWSELEGQDSEIAATGSLWEGLKERMAMSRKTPRRADRVEMSVVAEPAGTRYALKNVRDVTYVRLNEQEKFLWDMMDGTNSIQDLAVAFFSEFGSFGFGRITGLIASLEAKGFLEERPVSWIDSVRNRFDKGVVGTFMAKFWSGFIQREFPIRKIDRLATAGFRYTAWLFSRPSAIIMAIITVLGIVAFSVTLSGDPSLVFTFGGSVGLGVLVLYGSKLVTLFIHESAHALTVKAYGRDVHKGGFMIYFGNLAAYVDTTDIWMNPRRHRIAVSWAGPFSVIVVGGLCSLAGLFAGGLTQEILIKIAFMSFLGSFLNLNPLLEYDGYYILMDVLEFPRLRRRSLEFVRQKLRPRLLERLRGGKRFNREERVMTVFGLLSGAWTGITIYLAIISIRRILVNMIVMALASDPVTKVFLLTLVFIMGAPAVLALLSKGIETLLTAYRAVVRLLRGPKPRGVRT